MNETLKQLGETGIIPVVIITDAAKAVPVANALKAGGVNCAEITLRTDCAIECIKQISREIPDMLVGAGTVLNPRQADLAIEAGARFIVGPGFNEKVVRHCFKRDVAVTPGCITPSEMEAAMELGLDVVKFFPAEQAGGLEYIKAVSAPYANLKFIPTGGINIYNIKAYMSFDKVLAVGASYMVRAELIETENYSEITRLCAEAVNSAR